MFVVNSEQMKEIDNRAINKFGIPGIVQMEDAANAVFKHIKSLNPQKVLIICGGGNNGGDGFALARLLIINGFITEVFCFANQNKMSEDARLNLDILCKMGVKINNDIDEFKKSILLCDIVVDAVFGTGLKGEVRGIYNEIFKIINDSNKHIVSIDMPSGIDSDTGQKLGNCIYSDDTVTFCCYKYGNIVNEGRIASGRVILEKISIPQECISEQNITSMTCCENYPLSMLKKRGIDTNKGDYGKLFIIGGSFQMSGAVALAAKASLRSGAGLVTCVIPCEIIERVGSLVPEVTFLNCRSFEGKLDISNEEIDAIMSKADAIAIGPGVGISSKLENTLKYILEKWDKPLVIDADALNILSNIKDCLKNTSAKVCLTPHPGEMARLTGLDIKEINNRRLQIAKEFAFEYNCTVLLKGASTVVSDGRNTYINTTGNSGMASGGSGDVLTGIIASLAGQGYDIYNACVLGAYIHGLAGDEAYELYGNGLKAWDIPDHMGKFLKQ